MIQANGNKFTGLAVLGPSDIAVQSERYLFTLRFADKWAWQHSWPQAFRHAAATVLLISKFGKQHAMARAAAGAGLWSLPADVVHSIIQLAAGEHAEWLQGGSNPPQGVAPPPAFQGLSDEALLHPIVSKPLSQLRFAASEVGSQRLLDLTLPPRRPYMN